ncbi:MAG: hypothetical protein AAGN35_09580 [Bacteroidota bacterium]
MNGLKVYLKSGVARVYQGFQLVAGILLIANAYHFLEGEQKLVLEVLLSASWGVLCIAALFVPARWKRRSRNLVALLLLGAGGILFGNAVTALQEIITQWYSVYYYIGVFLMVLAVLTPFMNRRNYIFLSQRSIRIRNNPFTTHALTWADVVRVQMEERILEIELGSGKIFRLRPESSSSQHLRAHIDEASRTGLYQSKQESSASLSA